MTRRILKGALGVAVSLLATAAYAQDAAGPPAPEAAPPVLGPAFAGPMAPNANSFKFDLPGLGTIYAGGVVSGFGQVQSNHIPGDREWRGDVSNAMGIIQKVDGVFQFYVQAGVYSFPSLGTPYFKATTITDDTYGPVPVAFIKIAPSSSFSIQAGKLMTLIGAEGSFTFQNINVARGLLWNQENVVTKGVQFNYAAGKLGLNVSLTDGFYSGKYNWLSGLLSYTIDSSNVIAVGGGGALSYSDESSFRTPIFQNNSEIYNVIFTHDSGNWMIQPYLQYTHVPRLSRLGTTKASTYSGALLVKYKVSDNVTIPARVEYLDSTGRVGSAAPSLLYGQGSNAFSFTITPTYTQGVFFARAEVNYVRASSVTPGFAFGEFGDKRSQLRGVLEAGVVF